MKVTFTEAARGKLSQLSMSVELKDNKRFNYRKDASEIVALLKHASKSENEAIREKLLEFSEELSEKTITTLKSLGITFEDAPIQLPSSKTAKTYRGQKILGSSPKSTSEVNKPESIEDPTPQKKKKIVYRGKVTYV